MTKEAQKIKLDLSKINRIINPVYRPYLTKKSRYFMLKGGAGSGKSVFITQKILYHILTEGNHTVLILRRYKVSNRDSTFEEMLNTIKKWGVESMTSVRQTDMHIDFPEFNSRVIFGGMDDVEKVKSVSGITIIWYEEISEEENEDNFDQLDLRLRGDDGVQKQIIGSFNPVSEEHWLKARFFDDPDEFTMTSETTYKDNHFLDAQYKRMLEERMKKNPRMYDIYVKGKWGAEITGTEIYFSFHDDFVTKCPYYPDLPLHVSFDFNVIPYMTVVISQIEDRHVKVIQEVCAENPYNTVKGVCHLIKQRFATHSSGMFIYGDPSGFQTDAGHEGNLFSIAMRELKSFRPRLRASERKVNVPMRVQWINEMFQGEHNFKISIDDSCEKLLDDFRHVKQDAEGSKLKERQKNKSTGQTYEVRGHTSDAFEYMMAQANYNEFVRYTKGGRGAMRSMGVTKGHHKKTY